MESIKKKVGRPVKWNSIDLWNEFEKYKLHCKNTIKHYKPTLIHQTGEIVNVPFQTPLTITGFCSFSNISPVVFADYCNKTSEEYDNELTSMAIRIRTEIETFLDEGSAAGNLNASYTSKLRGLKDITENNIKTESGVINIVIPGIETNLTD